MIDVDVLEIARRIADEMERSAVPYAIGGAIAYGYWGAPRGTQDVDLNVFLDVDTSDVGLDALSRAGVALDRQAARAAIAEGAHVRGFVGRTPVDAFFDSIPFHQSAALRVVTRPLLGRPAKVLSAEDTSVLKMLFHRGKDRVDVERLVAIMGRALDDAYVRDWLVECVGEDDHRVAEWDEMVAQLGHASPTPAELVKDWQEGILTTREVDGWLVDRLFAYDAGTVASVVPPQLVGPVLDAAIAWRASWGSPRVWVGSTEPHRENRRTQPRHPGPDVPKDRLDELIRLLEPHRER